MNHIVFCLEKIFCFEKIGKNEVIDYEMLWITLIRTCHAENMDKMQGSSGGAENFLCVAEEQAKGSRKKKLI